jgi:hypothetical protein
MLVPDEADALFTVPLAVDTVQAKLAPVGVDVNAILVVLPEQIDKDEGVAVAVGLGFTVTGTVMAEPAQLFNVGVTL